MGLATVGLVYGIASAVRERDPILVLVLAGVVVGSLAGAAISLMKILADPYDQLPAIVFWLLGSLSAIRKGEVWAAPCHSCCWGSCRSCCCAGASTCFRSATRRRKRWASRPGACGCLVIAAATLMTASVVAISGVIGWVGLVIPHIARMAVGPSFDRLLPTAMLLGASYLAPRRYARPHHGPHRGADRHTHRHHRRAVLPVAAGQGPRGLVMTGDAPMLAAHGLGFGYGAKVVGRDVDLEVRPGEVLCLLGPNGSGKTTLFKTMLGLIAPQTGEVRVGGTPIASLSRQEIARRTAYVPQAHAAHFPFRVLDMVVMGRTAHLGLFASPTREDRRKALERAGSRSASTSWRSADTRASAAASASSPSSPARSPRTRPPSSWTSRPPASTSATRWSCCRR